MALDTAIPLQVQAPQIASPLQNIGGLMQLKGQMAEIALRNQQIETSKQNAADIAEQVQKRKRENDAQAKLSTILADPANHAKIRNGDLSPLWESGASPDVVNTVATGLNTAYQKALDLSKDQAAFHATGRGLVKDAIEGIDPKDDAIAAQQFNGAMQVIGKDHPELTQGFTPLQAGPNFRQQVKDIAANNSVAHAMLVDQAAQDKSKADTAKLTADAGKATADAYKTTALLPGEIAAQGTKNDQDSLTLAGTSKTGVTAKDQATEAETLRHNKKTEGVSGAELALKQKQFDATFGSGLDVNGQPLSPEAMKTAALQDPTAVAAAHYQIKGPPIQTRGGVPSPLLRKILAINPDYNDTTFPARNKTALDFSPAGASGKTITAADTALAHLKTLSDAGAALNNGDIQKLNQIANFLGAQTGKSAKETYDTINNMVSPEISKAVIGVAGGEGERQGTKENYSSDLNNATRESNIAATVGLLGARFDKQAHAYESEMGHKLPRELSPESQAIRQKYSGGTAAPASFKSGDSRVVNGVVYTRNDKGEWHPK